MANAIEARYIPNVVLKESNHIGGKAIDAVSFYEDTSYLLEGTGLPILAETETLERLVYEKIESEQYLSVVDEWLTMTEQNFFHFTQEHMRAKPLLGVLYSAKNFNGVDSLIPPKYSEDKTIAELSDFQERYGSQKKAIIGNPETGDEGFQAFFLRAPVGSIVARTSPPGWSGYQGYTYQEAQTQFMIKTEENPKTEVKVFNIRTTTTIEQSEELLKKLGISKEQIDGWKNLDEKQRLANITGTNVYFPSDSHPTTIEHLVEEWHDIFGDALFNKETYSFADVKRGLQQFDDLINLDTEVKERMEKVKNYARSELMKIQQDVVSTKVIPKDTLTNLQKVYGMMVLDFWMKIKHGSQTVRIDDVNGTYDSVPTVGFTGGMYVNAVEELRAAAGCPGVTSKNNNPFENPAIQYLENPYGGIYAEYNPVENVSGSCKEIACAREGCTWKPTAAQLKEIGKSITKCPECEWAPGDSTARKVKENTDTMTVFQRKENDPDQRKNKQLKLDAIDKKPDNKTVFSVKLFWGSSKSLQAED